MSNTKPTTPHKVRLGKAEPPIDNGDAASDSEAAVGWCVKVESLGQ
ncbi:hypothetical protein LMORI2_15730 [Limnohabitans sp. MORI2]|nr:hypothetical protein LMORI2_15730 [Limnohabitans sp. MORI2]